MFDPISLLINLVVGVVLSVGSTLLQQAFGPKPQQQRRRTGTRGSAQIGGRVPQYFLIGTVGEAGKLEYRNTWGNAGEVPNANLVDVISFGDLPISDLAGLYVNGVAVTVEESGSNQRGNPVPEYNSGGNHLWWQFFDGTQTTANSYLTGKFGADANRPWQNDMIGRGVPYLVMTALWDEKLWTGFPTYVGQFQGIPLYDPRKDSTAGGTGTQRWDDPQTWEFSDNNAVIIYNILRGIHYDGERVWGGSATAAQLPYDVWAAAMDACDEAVSLDAGGTEKRFRGGRRIDLNERPADIIKEFLIGANARISHAADGTIYILVGVPDEADGAFSDTDVLATEPLGSIPFPNLDDLVNGAAATYREPLQAWEDKETAPYYRSDLEAEDDGRRQVDGLQLETTFSGTQAQRILKAVIEEGRRFRRHVVALPPEFAQFRPLQVLAWTSERFGYEQKLFLITTRTRDPWGNVVFGLQEVDPADHNWNPATDETPLVFAPITTNRPAPQVVTGVSVEPYIGKDADGTDRKGGYLVKWPTTAVAVDVEFVSIVHRRKGETGIVWHGLIQKPQIHDGEAAVLDASLIGGQAYEVQVSYIAASGRPVTASEWLEVTVPLVKLTDLDVELSNIARDVLEQMGVKPRQLIEMFKQFGTLLEEVDRENYTKREALFREISVELEGLEASFTEIIEVALGPGGAIATALESLYAAMGGNTAEVNVRWRAQAAPSGYSARYAVQAAVNDGTFRAATFFLDVPEDTNQPTRIGLMAGQTAFFTSDGTPIVAISEDGKLRSANGSFEVDMITGDLVSSGNFSFG